MIQSVVRVLLVEDDEDDMILTTQLLRDIELTRFEVKWISDYQAALDGLCSDQFDVCLTDYRLGLHDGIQLVRDASHRGCRVPIIVLTGQGDHAVDMAAMHAGAADFLTKGHLTAASLERSIRYAIQHRKVEEQRIKLFEERSARAEAEAANRAKDEFLAVLSHELRTPLTAVLMSVSAMDLEAHALPERVVDLVRITKRNVELEARLIDDLLDLTRIARGKLEIRRELVDLHEQVRDAVHTCCGPEIAAKGLKVDVHTDAARPHVWGDSARLQQVLWNLIRNAVKFTPQSGRITIRTSNREEGSGFGVQGSGGTEQPQGNAVGSASADAEPLDPGENASQARPLNAQHSALSTQHSSQSAVLSPQSSSDWITIEVTDTGIGIEPEALPRIFNAFEQTGRNITRQFGGLGLGLAICRALVELHGGMIRAHSDGRGRGATFIVELPVAAVNAVPKPGPNGEPPPDIESAGRGLCILLVEDHRDTANAMTRILNRRGYDVHPTGSIAEALRAADGTPFDVVVSDIGLPDGSGLELMRQLVARGPIKGIALSGFGMEEDVNRSREAGFTEHLTKPIDIKQLEAAIGRVTGRRNADRPPPPAVPAVKL